jgi:RHH-type proline utilization regulon transcriptional repressor/proline dehydrogenase/delta 1-pyrroline-5-carboxylate dehydrogenase
MTRMRPGSRRAAPGKAGGDSAAALEAEIQASGRALLEAAEEHPPLTLSPEWWQQRILAWATQDPEFRVKLLRFVDVLPTLRTSAAIADHVRQYFRGPTPTIVRAGSGLASAGVFRPVLSRVVRQSVFSMAQRFIAGETPAEALPKLRELASAGIACTVDLLGEATLSEVEAEDYLRRYSELLETLSARLERPAAKDGRWEGVPAVNISIKLTALYSQFEPAAPGEVSAKTRERLRPLFRLARERGAFINIDMEQFRYKDLVHRIFRDLLLEPEFRDFAEVGVVVQAYLRDARDDIAGLRRLAEERGAPFSVRLVKGAYWDEERIVASQNQWPVPVWEEKEATDAWFEECTGDLLAAWPHLRPAFGTHNPRSAAQAAVRARLAGLGAPDIEFQTLYGMAEGLRTALAGQGYRTRVYVPVGEVIPGMAYLVRRLLENTSNQSWFVKEPDLLSAEELLAPPRLPSREGRQGRRARRVFTNEPPARFFEGDQREAMAAALEKARRDFGREYPLVIGRDEVGRREHEEVRYPADSSTVIGRVARATADDAGRAVAEARGAFEAWRARPASERAAILRRAAALMRERRWELAATMCFESAKPWHEADGDVAEAVDYLECYASEAERHGTPLMLGDVLGEENAYVHEGRGVVAVIAPWNFPLAIIGGMSSAAIAGGNCAILKPAAQSPIIAAKLVRILREAGVPPGVVQYLPGPGREVGQALVEHPGVDMIAFTGSKAVGLGIVRAAAEVRPGQRNLKRVIAEMGGKNAIIVDDDADLDQAVAGTVVSAFGYAGQKCSACSRLIVVGSAYEEAVERLAHAVESLVVGPPHDPATFVPPVISAAAKEGIEGYIASGREIARLLVEGGDGPGAGHFVRPTVFVDVPRDAPIACEEIFGPVLSVFRAGSFGEALEIALDSEYALTGGVFSRNPRHIEQARARFRVGNLYINRKTTGAIVGRQPFGGLRMSGVGDKAGGPEYLLQFMEPRTITENTMRRGFAPEAHPKGGL